MTHNVKFRKNISTFSLTMTGVTTIIGSGWLLGTQKIAEIAGPASLISWGIGALVALLVALFYIEMGSIYPSTGGIGYYSHITHGRFCGFLTSWINWLSIVAVAPIEALAVIQYLSKLNAHFALFYDATTRNLTGSGMIFALLLMLLFMLVNYWSVRLFIRFNNVFTLIKVAIPLMTIVALIHAGLHPQNFGHSLAEFMPNGFSSVLTSVVTCGVVMSFNGFQSPLNFSEEIANPKRMLPIAVVSSILIAFIMYLLLQMVFIGNVDPKLASQGWQHINFNSPYVALLLLANMHIMVVLLYADAVISPSVGGVAFIASSARILHSLSKENHIPAFFSKLHAIYHSPRRAIVASTLIGGIFVCLFKGWYNLVAVVSVLHIFSYLAAPIITIANRLKHQHFTDQNYKHFVMPFAHWLAVPLLFALSLLIFYSAWPLVLEMALLIIPGFFFYFYYEYKIYRGKGLSSALQGGVWLILHIACMAVITYLGNNAAGNSISIHTSLILIAVLSIITYVLGVHLCVSKEEYRHPVPGATNPHVSATPSDKQIAVK
jgi:amino acid transporter